MASKLKKSIESLANQFADALLVALSDASFAELSRELRGGEPLKLPVPSAAGAKRGAGGSKGGGGRRGRRSSVDLEKAIGAIVATLKGAGARGMRAEDLRRKVGLARSEMMRPVALALSTKRIRKTGEKRATTYFVR